MPVNEASFDPYREWLQIAPDRRPPNHYDLLGLPDFESDLERIRSAGLTRTSQVRRYQLGRHADDALRLIGELSTAFDCLTTPQRKLQYDDALRAALAPPAASTPEPLAAPSIEIRTTAPVPARSSRRQPKRHLTIGLLATGCVAVLLLLVFVARQPASTPPVAKGKTTATKKPAQASTPQTRPQPKPAVEPRKNTSFNPPPAPPPSPPANQSSQEKWQIVSARYGFGARWADTTATVRQNIRNDRIRFQIHNGSMRIDPAFGNIKSLEIELARGDQTRSLRFREGQWVVLNLADPEPVSK